MNAVRETPIRSGVWTIESVLVNSETVLNNDGFLRVEIQEDQVSIEPVGFRFDVTRATDRSAILESRGQIYFAEFSQNDDQLCLELARPQFEEVVKIDAVRSPRFAEEPIPMDRTTDAADCLPR